jgi:hypothetical protein
LEISYLAGLFREPTISRAALCDGKASHDEITTDDMEIR